MTAGPSEIAQRLYSPASKSQVKNIQRLARAKSGITDVYQDLLRIRNETNEVQLLMFSPNLLMVIYTYIYIYILFKNF